MDNVLLGNLFILQTGKIHEILELEIVFQSFALQFLRFSCELQVCLHLFIFFVEGQYNAN